MSRELCICGNMAQIKSGGGYRPTCGNLKCEIWLFLFGYNLILVCLLALYGVFILVEKYN